MQCTRFEAAWFYAGRNARVCDACAADDDDVRIYLFYGNGQR